MGEREYILTYSPTQKLSHTFKCHFFTSKVFHTNWGTIMENLFFQMTKKRVIRKWNKRKNNQLMQTHLCCSRIKMDHFSLFYFWCVCLWFVHCVGNLNLFHAQIFFASLLNFYLNYILKNNSMIFFSFGQTWTSRTLS